jgi:murein DD-endopeptidase MepM/ murein hydrolase activator NlpD
LQKELSAGGLGHRLRSWFPDREFFMRSQGQVRFIKISSRVQMVGAAIVAILALAWAITMISAAWTQYRAEADRLSLLEREAKVATATERVNAYREDLNLVSEDLGKRMEFLEQMTEALPADVVTTDTVTDSTSEAAETIEKVSLSIPEAIELARIEARQLAYVERLTRFADQRSERAESAIRKLGLDPRLILRNAERDAMGGPLELLATSSNGDIDPRFERLGLSLARMAALERGLEGIPQVSPTNRRLTRMTSGYGYRRDPFTRRAAMHRGLDFKGPTGSPIYAAAKGTISFVGRKRGYGNVVEISHGNGLMTRYAHMSRFHARVGENVEAGERIGAIGSTGRSTGPHLHFEVRVNDRAVNPRPLLESAPNVLKEARSSQSPSNAS